MTMLARVVPSVSGPGELLDWRSAFQQVTGRKRSLLVVADLLSERCLSLVLPWIAAVVIVLVVAVACAFAEDHPRPDDPPDPDEEPVTALLAA